ncbi:MAG TPA: CPBP family intramembrane glutamic endopeptidase [Thermoanaerobaculia bacterium]|nr:CPBP family intramembrane glutamic endopeptidase [Thermoanaerobaculia bacterium]
MASTAPPLGPLTLLVRLLGPAVLAFAGAWLLDWMCGRKGLMPPGFRHPWRRLAAAALVFFILWFGIFAPLGTIGLPQPKLDLSSISTPRLFLLHGMLVGVVLGWFALGFVGGGIPAAAPGESELLHAAPAEAALAAAASEPPFSATAEVGAVAPSAPVPVVPPPPEAAPVPPREPIAKSFARQFGLVAPSISREVLIGLALGACAWGAVLLALFVAALAIYALGGEKALPKPSAIVPWIASLPVLVRVMVSLSAGFVEEIFFRGFLQPRIGIALSTGCFVLAHLSYGQPFMLFFIALLSLIYASLVRWRQTIWPTIAAHALFDGVQLLVIIPLAMKWVRPAPGALDWIW